METIDQPGEILENEITPLREFGGGFALEKRFTRPVVERDQHAVVGDNDVDGPIGIFGLHIDHTVKTHRDGVEIFLLGRGGFSGVFLAGFGVDVADGRFLGLVFEHAGVPGHANFGWVAEVLRGSFQELRFLPENPHHQKESHQCGHKVRKGYFPCSAAVSSHDN